MPFKTYFLKLFKPAFFQHCPIALLLICGFDFSFCLVRVHD